MKINTKNSELSPSLEFPKLADNLEYVLSHPKNDHLLIDSPKLLIDRSEKKNVSFIPIAQPSNSRKQDLSIIINNLNITRNPNENLNIKSAQLKNTHLENKNQSIMDRRKSVQNTVKESSAGLKIITNDNLKHFYANKLLDLDPRTKTPQLRKLSRVFTMKRKFFHIHQIAIGIIRIRRFFKKKRTNLYLKNFSELLKGADNDNLFNEQINFVDIPKLHSKLLRRNIYEDSFFIEVEQKETLKSLIYEFENFNDEFPLLWIRKIIKYLFGYFRIFCQNIIETKKFIYFTVGMIILNSVSVYKLFILIDDEFDENDCYNLMTIKKIDYKNADFYILINYLCILFFVCEIIFKLMGLGLTFFNDIFNILDIIITYFSIQFAFIGIKKNISLLIFKDSSLKIDLSAVRIFRIVAMIPMNEVKIMLLAIHKSLFLLGETFLIFFFFGSLYAIIGVHMMANLMKNRCIDPITGFSDNKNSICGNSNCPNDYICWKSLNNLNDGFTNFDNFFMALLQTLKMVTFSNWSGVMYQTQQTFTSFIWIYYFTLIIFGNFFLLNLTIAVLKVKFSENVQNLIIHQDKFKKFNYKFLLENRILKTNKLSFDDGKISEEKKNRNNNVKTKKRFEVKENKDKKNNLNETFKKKSKISKVFNFIKFVIFAFFSKNFKIERKISEIKSPIKIDDKFDISNIKIHKLSLIINIKLKYFGVSSEDVLPNYKIRKIERKIIENQLKKINIPIVYQKKNENKSKSKENALGMNYKKSFSSNNRKLKLLKEVSADKKASLFMPKYKNFNFSPAIAYDTNFQQNSIKNIGTMKNPKKTIRDLRLIINKKRKKEHQIVNPLMSFIQISHLINRKISNFDEEIPDYDQKYMKIKEFDLKFKQISKMNWSGYSVLRHKKSLIEYWNQIFDQLSDKNINIWRKGFQGKILCIKISCKRIISSGLFFNINLLFILASLINLSLEGSIDNNTYKIIFYLISHWFLFEFLLKILGMGLREFMKQILNKIDLYVLIYSLILNYFSEQIEDIQDENLKSIRLLKVILILRVFRILSHIEYMNFIVKVLKETYKSFIFLAFLLITIILVFGIISKQIYSRGCDFSKYAPEEKSFEDIFSSMIAIYNTLLIDNWDTVLSLSLRFNLFYPSLVIILFLMFYGNFIILNLFIAVLLRGFEEVDRVIEEEKNKKNLILTKTNKELLLKWEEDKIKKNIIDHSKTHLSISENSSQNTLEEINSPVSPGNRMHTDFKDNTIKSFNYFEDNYCQNSLFIFSTRNRIRKFINRLSKNKLFSFFVYLIIILNSFVIGLDTFVDMRNEEEKQSSLGKLVIFANYFINIFFCLECCVKIISDGFLICKGAYLRDYRNVMDFITIIISIINLSVNQADNSIFKIVLLIRLWRPLSIAYKQKYILSILKSLVSSISEIFNVFLVVFLVGFMYSLVGIQLYRDRFGFCDHTGNFRISKLKCDGKWIIEYMNFDNILKGLSTIFHLSTQDSWSKILNIAVNSDTSDKGPLRNNNQFSSYIFFVSFNIIVVWLIFNLFIGVIFTNFMKITKKNSHPFLNENQIKWLEIQKIIFQTKSIIFIVPESGLRKKLFSIINSNLFNNFITISIIINFFIMAIYYEPTSNEYKKNLDLIALILSIVYLIEIILKIIVFSKNFFDSNWNTLALISSILFLIESIISLLFREINIIENANLYKILKFLKILKMIPLFRLIEKFKSLKDLLTNLLLSLKLILNMILLMFLLFFVFAVIGVYMFKDVKTGETIGEYANFKNLFYALMTLFKCATKEEWHYLISDLSKIKPDCIENQTCGNAWAPLYFSCFMIINSIILLNLFMLILLQQFEEFHSNKFNLIQSFKDYLPDFQKTWYYFCKENNKQKQKIQIFQIIRFLKMLPPPLGISYNSQIKDFGKNLINMDIKCNNKGKSNFNEFLYAIFKSFFWDYVFDEKINRMAVKYLFKEERKFYYELEKNKIMKKIKLKKNKNDEDEFYDYSQFQILNPLDSYFFHLTLFNSWKKFSYKNNKIN